MSDTLRIYRQNAFQLQRNPGDCIRIVGVDVTSPEFAGGLRNGDELLYLQTGFAITTFSSLPRAREALATTRTPYWIAVVHSADTHAHQNNHAILPMQPEEPSRPLLPKSRTTDSTTNCQKRKSSSQVEPAHQRTQAKRICNDTILPTLRLAYGTVCPYCGFQYFAVERKYHPDDWCCDFRNRQAHYYPPTAELPNDYATIILPKQLHFNKRALNYNNYFALAAIGISPSRKEGGQSFLQLKRPSFIKIQGRIYHRLLDRQYQGQVRYLLYDAASGRQAASEQQLNSRCVDKLRRFFTTQNVHFNQVMQMATKIHDCCEVGVRLRADSRLNEIAAIVPSRAFERQSAKTVVIYNKLTEQPEFLGEDHPLYEPLSYPLLFPKGESGWCRETASHVSLLRYLRTKLLMPDHALDTINSGHPINRFDLLPRLGQVYFVDGFSRVLDKHLRYIKTHQKDILGPDYSGKNDKIIVPESVHGSFRHRRELSLNALTLMTRYGRPTIFLTVTCNPAWEEITRELLAGQSAYDRAALTARVFNAKLRLLLEYLRRGQLFGRMVYEVAVIEFQRRGLPHCHIVMKFDTTTSQLSDTEWIDNNISACISTTTDDKELHDLVQAHMIHKHNNTSSCMKDGQCDKHFPKGIVAHTTIDEFGYPIYARRTHADTTIVPYNPVILKLWQGHANIEYAATVNIVFYLYKYVYKGPDHINVTLAGADEFEYLNHYRFLSAEECVWRILGYQTYPRIHPTVVRIKVHLPRTEEPPNTASHFQLYLNRPSELMTLKFTELFETHIVATKLPKRAELQGDNHYNTIVNGKRWFYYRRTTPVIARIELLYPAAGEKWFLRLIATQRPICSYEDARTIDGKVYATFQEAAKAGGFLSNQNECILALRECLMYKSPAELRTLFSIMTMEGFPTVAAIKCPDIENAMLKDFLQQCHGKKLIARQTLLQALQRQFTAEGKSMSTYGLPEPEAKISEYRYMQLLHDPQEEEKQLRKAPPLTQEQQAVFDTIMSAIDHTDPETNATTPSMNKLFFVQGRGGSGKSFLMNRILLATRAQGKIALVCATTALAASIYDGGVTAHALFKLEVRDESNDQEPLQSFLKSNTERMELLQHAQVIIWDEFPNAHRDCFETTYKVLKLFPHMIFIGCGDFRQIPPVVEHGGRQEITFASITRSQLWASFQVLQLTQSVRDRQDPEYARLVLAIGNGQIGEACDNNDEDTGAMIVQLPLRHVIDSEDEKQQAIRFVYPTITGQTNASAATETTTTATSILATTNNIVDEWNSSVQAMTPGATTVLLSADTLAEADDYYHRLRFTTEYLNSVRHPNIPDHALRLKVGDICLLTQNLSQSIKLTNNQRIRILDIQRFSLRVQLLSDNTTHTISRIHFYFRIKGASYQIRRTQFPVRLAYAMTYNKSQGQTFDRVVVDVRHRPFSHGHLYVALSRVRCSRDIVIVSTKDQVDTDTQYVQCINVCWPELLTF